MKQASMSIMLILFFLIGFSSGHVMVAREVVDECPEEFAALNSTCDCIDSSKGHDIWCPSLEKPNFHIHFDSPAMWIICDEVDKEADVIFLLRNVLLGDSVDTIELKSCPIPSRSYADYIDPMNMTRLIDLRIKFGRSATTGFVAGMFESFVHLEKLTLNNNAVTGIDPETFRGLGHVRELTLNSNKLGDLGNHGDLLRTLVSLDDLVFLDNTIQSLPADIFRSQTKMTELKMDVKKVRGLGADHFATTKQLSKIEMFNLDVATLRPEEEEEESLPLFHYVSELTNVTLSVKDLSSIPINIFTSNLKLQFLDFKMISCSDGLRDCITQPPSFLRNITSLESLTISRTRGSGLVLNEDFFWGCTSLKSVKIIASNIKILPDALFRDLLNVHDIDLSYNSISVVPSLLFHPIRNLLKLRIRRNQISVIDDLHFKKANQLMTLDMSDNKITSVAVKAFANLNKLEQLSLQENVITFGDENEVVWRGMTNLQRLNIANNNISISHMPEEFTTTYVNLNYLNMSHNNIGPMLDVLTDMNFHQSKGIEVDLAHNDIRHLSYTKAHQYLKPTHAQERHISQVNVDLRDNPFYCDCRNIDLALQLRGKLQIPAVATWFRLSDFVSCRRGDQQIYLDNIPTKDLSCDFPSDFLDDACPQPCKCSITPYLSDTDLMSLMFVNCSNHETLPSYIPRLPEHVDGITLDLSNKNLTSISGLYESIIDYNNITGLLLSHNQLTELNGTALPPNLTSVAFDHNAILRVDHINKMSKLKSVWLGGNPYKCDCNSRGLYRFVKRNTRSVVRDPNDVVLDCKSGLLAVSNITQYEEFCNPDPWLVPISLIVAFTLVLLIMFIVFLLKRETIYIWVYSKPWLRSICFFREEDTMNKTYDVFISYAHEDANFVEELMVPNLEDQTSEFSYKCLVHVRDFIPGQPIAEQIIDAVDSSNRTLIVLSTSFVASDWARHE
jgi:Leucine-rich repeat (LRR) protein